MKIKNIKINSVHFDADKKLVEFVEGRIEKLTHFYEGIMGADVFLRLDNDQSKENKVVGIRLENPGLDLFAEKQAKTFEEATDQVIEALRRQIRKKKTKEDGH